MQLLDNFFVFPSTVNTNGKLKFNITDDEYACYFQANNEKEISCSIKRQLIPKNSVTLFLHDYDLNHMFVVTDWKRVKKMYPGLTMTELLYKIQHNCFMQIDNYYEKDFVKVFLPKNQFVLESDTHDMSFYCHIPIEALHPLDFQYQIDVKIESVKLENDNIIVNAHFVPSVIDDRIYCAYENQNCIAKPGDNTLKFIYTPNTKLRIGRKPEGEFDIDLEEMLCNTAN